ncbi:unnamed protein product [Brassicogethes aeneus]|uniref:USP domain-containing protein n=1 Tax=Brassicogethes aeneus TaxID=1431903 RepID=A0A9P0AT85_BRAAE|nr:unnamed protein product [Brassicogethes aeneus]
MAVKQKVSECVDPSAEARLQTILRALQDIRACSSINEKTWVNIVSSLGTVLIPSDPVEYKRFIGDIENVLDILAKECSSQELIFFTLKSFYDEISKPEKQLSPVMSIVLQLMDVENIPTAVKYILNMGYHEQSLERALYTLCTWLKKWTWTKNLGPLVLAFMRGLENEHHYDILVDVTVATVDQLFLLLILPDIRKSVEPVVFYMLSRVQHSPQAFHKIAPHVKNVIEMLERENSESSRECLAKVVRLCVELMLHFPGYASLYEPLKKTLHSYYSESKHQHFLDCKSWSEGSGTVVPSRCFSGKVGLNNLGNTCYMNSVLQALFMTKTFRNRILLNDKEMMALFSKLQVLFALLQHSKKYSLSPNDILNLSRPPGFVPGHQHDSSEFLGYLLDTLHEQEKNLFSQPELDDSMTGIVPTMVQESFGGKTGTVSQCDECLTKSERGDNFRELQLSFPPSICEDQSVQTLLHYYLQPEKLSGDNQYHCDNCGRLTDGERVTKIIDPPQRLVLTLKHFRYDPALQQRTKILQRVKLNSHLQLENQQYELYAAVVHCGSSVDSGHYYTFARDGSDWYKFNDCSVMKTTGEDLCKLKPPETPYILFYVRQDCVEPENLPCALLSSRLQSALSKDLLEYETDKKKPLRTYNTRQNRNDDPPPPGCGGGGFNTNNSNMFVC